MSAVTPARATAVAECAAWAALIAVPPMIAGVYRMNFERMRELRRPLVLGVMAVAALVVHRLPRRSGRL